MKNPFFRILPALVFTGVALLAVFRNRDFVEAAIWILFALAVVLPVLPDSVHSKKKVERLALVFMVLGILLLALRLLNVFPVPIRPLPQLWKI